MIYSLSYSRPALVRADSSSHGRSPSPDGSVHSQSAAVAGIPEALSFDRMINGSTFTPCTIRDFMNYLIYVEHAAENLQFFLWFRYYTQRFADLSANERELSQPWTFEKDALTAHRVARPQSTPKSPIVEVFEVADGDEKYTPPSEKVANPFDDGYSTRAGTDDGSSTAPQLTRQEINKSAAMAYESANVKLQPFTIQPFREEITRIIATYIADDAPRQLNLSGRERKELLQALAKTTHPSAFREVVQAVEWTLRRQAHPNFIRYVINNCNRSRLRFCACLGATILIAGVACLVALTLSSAHRPWRVISMLPLTIGIAMLFCVGQGVCLVLHLLHHRHLRPWELFLDESNLESSEDLKRPSLDSLGSVNSYEDEPWVARYEKRNIIRKIFDREIWTKDPSVRRIQDTIFVQALLSGMLASAVIVGIFCAVPQLNRF